MAGLFRNSEGAREGKYLVKRRDGSVPQWPRFVLGASDPAAPAALRAYAKAAQEHGMDHKYVADVILLAHDFDRWRETNKSGDPDAPRHRIDDPATVAEMQGRTPVEAYAVLIRHHALVDRVALKVPRAAFPETWINAWVPGNIGSWRECSEEYDSEADIFRSREEAEAHAVKLMNLTQICGDGGYRFTVIQRRMVPRWFIADPVNDFERLPVFERERM